MKKLKEKLSRVFETDSLELSSSAEIEDVSEEDLNEEEAEEETQEDEDNHPQSLPALVTLPSLPPPALINIDTPEREHQQADLDLTNNNLQIIHQAWKARQLSIRDACLLIDKTHSTIENRRKVLNRQYGYQGDGARGGKIPTLD